MTNRMTVLQRPEHGRRNATLLAIVGALAALGTASAAELQPYKARYQVSYRGLNGGSLENTLKRGTGPNQWVYQTQAFPSMLARVAVSPDARETSTFEVLPKGVRPLSFNLDDGKPGEDKDQRHAFDWKLNTATGMANGKQFTLPIPAGTQDTSSISTALMYERLSGRKPTGFPLLAGGKLRQYRYRLEAVQQVLTPFGQVEAEIWVSDREGSDRTSKVWYAPSLGYVPVQAIQYRKGNPELQMKLLSLTR